MNVVAKIIITLIIVHFLTLICLFVLKRTNLLKKFESLETHPANLGDTAFQIGGVVIIPITLLAAIILLTSFQNVSPKIQLVLCAPIMVLYFVGLIDDYKPISATMRLLIHFANATSATIIIYQLTLFSGLGDLIALTGYAVPFIFMVFAISWMINTTNFVDGMDLFLVTNIIPGIVLFSLLHLITNDDFNASVFFLILLSSLLGFVWFNKPKATVYMGDAGTLPIGFILGSCGVYILAKYGSIVGFIPFAYILVDTTFTLIYRIKNGYNPFQSHNHHAYQIAARGHRTNTNIRVYCFIASVMNTALAYLCIQADHEIKWQMIFGIIAFIISLYVFLMLRNTNSKKLKNSI